MTREPDRFPVDPEQFGASRPPHRLSKAILAIPLLAGAGWLARAAKRVPHDLVLPPAVSGARLTFDTPGGRLSYYRSGPSSNASVPPLLLVHSINAAGSAYEVKPIYEHHSALRPVYAVELPGFGFSAREARLYTPRLMTDAVLAMVEHIRGEHGTAPIDALAVSLSCEFLARAAVENPGAFRTVALVSPTGLDRRGPRYGEPGSDRGLPMLHKALTGGPWRRSLFDLLTSRVSIRYFLEKTWGSKAIDEGLLDYDYLTTHQPGAEHAPYSFISGFLFSNDVGRLYEGLAQPIWMSHGVRGDFVDYSGKRRFENRANWTIDVFETGALPHFEQPETFLQRYGRFLEHAA